MSFNEFYRENTLRKHLPGLPVEISISGILVETRGDRNSERGSTFYQQIWLLPTGNGYVVDGTGNNVSFQVNENKVKLENKVTYLTAKLKFCAKSFETLKQALLGNRDDWGQGVTFTWDDKIVSELGDDPRDGKLALERIKKAVNVYRKLLKIVETEYSHIPEIAVELEAKKKRAERDHQYSINKDLHEKNLRSEVEEITL